MIQNKKTRSFNPHRFLEKYGKSLGKYMMDQATKQGSGAWPLKSVGSAIHRGDFNPTLAKEVHIHLDSIMKVKFKDLPLHINSHALLQKVIVQWRLQNGI